MKRLLDTLNWTLLALMMGFSLWAWLRLPEQIPTHFGFQGHPDAWSPRTLGHWFSPPAVAVALIALIGFFRLVLPQRPHWVNLPDRRRLSDLPEPCQKQVLEMLAGFLALVQTELLVIFGLIEWASFHAALRQESQALMILALLLAVLSSPVLVIVFFLQFQKAMDRGMEAVRRAEAPVAGGAGIDAGGRDGAGAAGDAVAGTVGGPVEA